MRGWKSQLTWILDILIFVPFPLLQKFEAPRCFQTYCLGPSHSLVVTTCILTAISHLDWTKSSTWQMLSFRCFSLWIYLLREFTSSCSRFKLGEFSNAAKACTITTLGTRLGLSLVSKYSASLQISSVISSTTALFVTVVSPGTATFSVDASSAPVSFWTWIVASLESFSPYCQVHSKWVNPENAKKIDF